MRPYGSKKASRPYEQIHKNCAQCKDYNEVKTKSRRSKEKQDAMKEIKDSLVEISADEYEHYRDIYQGYCTNCKEFTKDGTEPDATGYDCPQCEKPTVMGAEEALMCGEFEICLDDSE